VFVFSGLDRLKVPPLGGAGDFPHVWCVVLLGRSCCLVVFATEDGQVGGPPRFGVMGGPGYRCMLFEESDQSVQYPISWSFFFSFFFFFVIMRSLF